MASTVPIQRKIFSDAISTFANLLSDDVIFETENVFEIENFENGYKDNQETSSKITIAAENLSGTDIQWCLKCAPRSPKNLCKIDFVITSERWELNRFLVSQSLKLSNGMCLYRTDFQYFEKKAIVRSVFVDFDFLLQHLTSDGSLCVIAKLEIKTLGQKTIRHLKARRNISNQFDNVLNDPTFSDFTFIVKDREFKVHKAIVAASSAVMRQIFSTNLLESKHGQCKVADIEPEIFDYLLRFMYTGRVPAILNALISLELLKAAHYYEISLLVEICKEDIRSKINAENAVVIYGFATIYDLNDLKLDAWNIVKSHVLKIFIPLKDEPLPIEDVREIIEVRKREKEILLKHIL